MRPRASVAGPARFKTTWVWGYECCKKVPTHVATYKLLLHVKRMICRKMASF